MYVISIDNRFIYSFIRFTVRAVVDKNIYPNGTGRNKKEAKQNAAKNALDGLDTESNDTVRCSVPS